MDIESYMPHRGRMKLIDDLLSADETTCTAVATPHKSWPFQTGEGIDPLIIIELIAQATSAFAGWRKRHEKQMGGAGFLVGVRKSQIALTPLPLGLAVYISCSKVLDMDSYGVFDGKVYSGETLYGTATIQVYNS